jgi:saccharopine dehydrogenase (NAD+, L-lysine-forming)
VRVAVLGAGGTIAPAIVRDLGESPEVSHLLLLDLDIDRAQSAAARHGNGKATATAVDARADGALAARLDGSDVLVNAASYRVNLDAMRAALAAGCHYLDLGGLYHMTARQLELSDEFERAGLIALLGIGSAPGKTNLMARVAVREVVGADLAAAGGEAIPASPGSPLAGARSAAGNGSIEELCVSAAGRDLDPPPGFSLPYALRTILDELTLAPIVVRDGGPVALAPLEPGGSVDFGAEIGVADTIHTLHSEVLTFPASFGCREASFRLSLAPGVVERVRELAGAPAEDVEAAAREVASPSPRTVAVHLVEARAGERAAVIRAITRPHERWGIGGGVVSTAAPTAAAVRLLARGELAARGALPPERCLEPEPMFAELEARGCRFETEMREAEPR